MSQVQLTKIAKPGTNPPVNLASIYYDTAGPGAATPAALCALDESGNQAMLGHFGILDYRLLKVTILVSGTSWVPTNGCRAIYVECIGGGGQGGGAATSSSTASVGGGGGGGAFAASWLTGAAVKNPTTYAIGAAGSGGAAGASGGNGGNTLWDTSVIIAAGGTGGAAMVAGSTLLAQIGGAGGAAGSCTGDMKVSGGMGDKGIRISASQGWSGNGGAAAFLGSCGANGVVAVTGGAAGTAGATGAYGCGGSGAATITTSAAGGAGIGGMIRVFEFG